MKTQPLWVWQWEKILILIPQLFILIIFSIVVVLLLLISLIIMWLSRVFIWVREEVDCLLCIYGEMAVVWESSLNLLHSHVRLYLQWAVCQSNYWLPIYVLGFSQDGTWVPKRQPGWWYISFWPKVIIMAFHFIVLVETGLRVECQCSIRWSCEMGTVTVVIFVK